MQALHHLEAEAASRLTDGLLTPSCCCCQTRVRSPGSAGPVDPLSISRAEMCAASGVESMLSAGVDVVATSIHLTAPSGPR